MNVHLRKAIKDKSARVVILGLGYVGLPVACLFAEAGLPVVGLDIDEDKVATIQRGECPIEGDEPGLPELLRRVVNSGRFRATIDYGVCQEAQIVLIAVETPVDSETKKPRYEALRAALTDLGAYLSPHTMVIVESTIAPGTMERVVQPVLEEASGLRASKDFYLVNCPERLMPGRLLRNIRTMHRVVGAMSPEAAEMAVQFYRHVVEGDLDPVDCLTAELTKTVENAYRDVQIAFANEMALLCEDLGADVWRVRELVNKSPGRHMLYPGAGVGGHCIPKDPWLLIANASADFAPRLIPAARAINDGMPHHVADLTVEALAEAGVEIAAAKVAVLGYAYRENSDDVRNSPSEVLATRLQELGAQVTIHDPYVKAYQGELEKRIQGCDAVVIMVAHDEYQQTDWGRLKESLRHPVVVDGRHTVTEPESQLLGFIFQRVGGNRRRTSDRGPR